MNHRQMIPLFLSDAAFPPAFRVKIPLPVAVWRGLIWLWIAADFTRRARVFTGG